MTCRESLESAVVSHTAVPISGCHSSVWRVRSRSDM